ncbi:MAG TPA: hypothetical protein DCQ98_11305 [Planctomycetaceae bacterium]|nr:hypothetical protein [Planctomycetaceae bacterium]
MNFIIRSPPGTPIADDPGRETSVSKKPHPTDRAPLRPVAVGLGDRILWLDSSPAKRPRPSRPESMIIAAAARSAGRSPNLHRARRPRAGA